MVALLGYLVAVAVFLSGGYLGLEWLASPDVVTHARSRDSSTSHLPEVAPKRTAPSIAIAKDAAVGTQPDSAAVRRGKPGIETADAAEATGDISKNQKPGGVPAGACMPIGVTTNGQMVFPLQCRELIERQHGPTSPASVELAAPAPSLQDTRTRKIGTNDNIAASPPKQPEPSTSAPVANKIAEDNDRTHGPYSSKPETGQKIPEHVAAAPTNEIGPRDVLAPIPPKSNAERVAVVKPKRIEKMKPGQDRSKLVAMTLETLRFEDGHLEHRLVPLKRSARTAMQSDWYNPLGLR